MKPARLLVLAVVTSLLSVVVPSSARAVTSVEAWGKDVTVRYSGCEYTRVGATGDWTDDESSEIELDVFTPAGRRFDGATFKHDEDGSVSTQVRFCASDREGRYRVRVKVKAFDDEGTKTVQKDWSPVRYEFVPRGKSRIVRDISYRPKKVWKYLVLGRLFRQGHGYVDRLVALQVDLGGGYWVDIEKMRTRKRGYVGWVFKPNPYRWRYRFTGNTSTWPSISDPFRTPRKAKARPVHGAELGDIADVVRPVD